MVSPNLMAVAGSFRPDIFTFCIKFSMLLVEILGQTSETKSTELSKEFCALLFVSKNQTSINPTKSDSFSIASTSASTFPKP